MRNFIVTGCIDPIYEKVCDINMENNKFCFTIKEKLNPKFLGILVGKPVIDKEKVATSVVNTIKFFMEEYVCKNTSLLLDVYTYSEIVKLVNVYKGDFFSWNVVIKEK